MAENLTTDLLTGSALLVKEVRPLSSGGQGEASLVKVDGRPGIFVDKRLRIQNVRSSSAQHAIAFVHHVLTRTDPATRERLPGLPVVVHAYADGTVAVLSRFVDGVSLEEGDSYAVLFRQGLAARLQVAASAASQLSLLHQSHIVWADPSEENFVLNLPHRHLLAIDVDGGGVLDGRGDFYPGLHPTVRYKPDGSLTAPEIALDPLLLPTPASDVWSLGVLIHRLLFSGIDALFWASTPDALLRAAVGWPLSQASAPGVELTLVDFHREILDSLGRVKLLLESTFKPVNGSWTPSSRPSAQEWARTLSTAASWVMPCQQCRREVVAWGVSHCPLCGVELPHARVLLSAGPQLVINQEGFTVTGRDLGLHHETGPIVRFRRVPNALVGEALVPLRLGDCFYRPDTWPTFAVPVGSTLVKVWSKDGWGDPATLVLEVR